MSFGFMIKTEEEFKELEIQLRKGIKESGAYSIFYIVENNEIEDLQISL